MGPMKGAFVLLLLACGMATHGRAADDGTAQRQRIQAERQAAQARLDTALADCANRFVQTSCIDAARAEHRALAERLHREEQLLAAEQRKQRAAERLRRIDTKMRALEAAEAAPATASAAAPRAARAPAPRVRAPRAGAVAPVERGPAVQARVRGGAKRGEAQARQRAQAQQQREQALAAHQAEVQRRNAERTRRRPPAAPLPVPN